MVVVCAVGAALPGGASAAFGPASTLATLGGGSGQVKSPAGIAIAANGDAYVADFGNSRIDVFSPAGTFLFAFGKEVNAGAGPDENVCTSACKAGVQDFSAGALWGPASVAFDADGNVFVADFGGFRVGVFTAEGEFLYAFGLEVNASVGNPDLCTLATGCKQGSPSGGAGSLTNPNGIGIDPDAGRVYVANTRQERINVYTTAGEFKYAFGKEVNAGAGPADVCESECKVGVGDGEAGAMQLPNDVKLTPGGQLAVADEDNGRIDIFEVDGTFVRAFGHEVNPAGGNVCTTECQEAEMSAAAGALVGPSAEAIDAAGTLYVSDYELGRVSQFELDGTFLRAFGEGVVNGAASFQSCTTASGCRAGGEGTGPGAIPFSFGVATSGSNVLVSEENTSFSRVEVFGQVADPLPPPSPGPTPPTPKPSNRFSFGKFKLNLETGTGVLAVKVRAAGKLVLKGAGIRQVKGMAKKAGTVKLTIKLVGAARKTLLKTGISKVTVKATFTPTGGDPLTHSKKLTLKAALPR